MGKAQATEKGQLVQKLVSPAGRDFRRALTRQSQKADLHLRAYPSFIARAWPVPFAFNLPTFIADIALRRVRASSDFRVQLSA
jgi:hypothetical protein